MRTKKPFLSVIIPVYNESVRIKNLPRIISFFKQVSASTEIVVVNDGSSDNTLQKLERMRKNTRFDIISYQKNRGKGYAVKTGMLSAKGKYRLFMDIDLSTPLAEYYKFKPFLDTYDVIIGSRRIKGADVVRHQSLLRESLGKVFTKISQTILGLTLSDFTCGFKCFSADSTKEVFTRQKIERWGFDSEILYLSTKLGLSIKEVPVRWKNNFSSRVKFPEDIIRSFFDLVKIRIYHMGKI